MLALTHIPSSNIGEGLRTHVGAVPVDLDLAVRQHAGYVRMLTDCGATVRTLNVNRGMPDSVFIEDTAIVFDEAAIIASLGTEARRPEADGIQVELGQYRKLHRIELPARLEGGDVLRVGRLFLVGLSARTDAKGAEALENIVKRYGYLVQAIPVTRCLHLKTACTALPDGSLLINPAWLDPAILDGFELMKVPEREPWGANVLCLSGRVCAASEHVETAELLRRRGYGVHTTPLSEFAKAEGAVTCMSLLLHD